MKTSRRPCGRRPGRPEPGVGAREAQPPRGVAGQHGICSATGSVGLRPREAAPVGSRVCTRAWRRSRRWRCRRRVPEGPSSARRRSPVSGDATVKAHVRTRIGAALHPAPGCRCDSVCAAGCGSSERPWKVEAFDAEARAPSRTTVPKTEAGSHPSISRWNLLRPPRAQHQRGRCAGIRNAQCLASFWTRRARPVPIP
jgi:hypothetical protein